jgi:hypothetical protein
MVFFNFVPSFDYVYIDSYYARRFVKLPVGSMDVGFLMNVSSCSIYAFKYDVTSAYFRS